MQLPIVIHPITTKDNQKLVATHKICLLVQLYVLKQLKLIKDRG